MDGAGWLGLSGGGFHPICECISIGITAGLVWRMDGAGMNCWVDRFDEHVSSSESTLTLSYSSPSQDGGCLGVETDLENCIRFSVVQSTHSLAVLV
jgi:hypothetical protein